MPGLSLDYTLVGWERRRGDWLESENCFQLLILHVCVLRIGFRNSSEPKLARWHILSFH